MEINLIKHDKHDKHDGKLYSARYAFRPPNLAAYLRLPVTTPCTICKKPTPMLGTKLCDRCWELSSRIRDAPDLARKILAELDKNKEIETDEVSNV